MEGLFLSLFPYNPLLAAFVFGWVLAMAAAWGFIRLGGRYAFAKEIRRLEAERSRLEAEHRQRHDLIERRSRAILRAATMWTLGNVAGAEKVLREGGWDVKERQG
jgi:hypothetical protein